MLEPQDLVSAIGVLLGFQFTAFLWRVSRELSFKDKYDEDELRKTGEVKTVSIAMAPADWLTVSSMLLNVIAVLLLLLGCSFSTSKALFGAGLVLFATYPLALLAHYRMFVKTDHLLPAQQHYVPATEVILICLGALAALIVGLLIACSS